MRDAQHKVGKFTACVAGICLMVAATSWLVGWQMVTGPALVVFFSSLAVSFMSFPSLRSYAFTVWVVAFVAASLVYPSAFGTWFGYDLKILITPLIQIIMFGMGTTLSAADFGRVLQMPWPVLVGIVLQFLIMPTVGFALASSLGFEAEIAAGIILIGACPGGVASNLMTYLARGNVALSVTMTACSTLLSPLLTPLMMKIFAERYIGINFVEMMLSILNLIIVPVVAGLIANRILYSDRKVFERAVPLSAMATCTLGLAGIIVWRGSAWLSWLSSWKATEWLSSGLAPLTTGVVLGSALVGIVTLVKLIVQMVCGGPRNWMDRGLPVVSMIGICYIIAIITARAADQLLHVGFLLLAASMIHNLTGYSLGYWLSRLLRLNKRDCRTVAIEVGMQNGGMASTLAMFTLHSVKAALAPAIFGPWMNVSGSMLATYWRNRAIVTVPERSGLDNM